MNGALGWIAHHIIPWSVFSKKHPLVMAAVRAGFPVNGAINGVLLKGYKLPGKQHVGDHAGYIKSVDNKLDAILARHGNVATRAALQQSENLYNMSIIFNEHCQKSNFFHKA